MFLSLLFAAVPGSKFSTTVRLFIFKLTISLPNFSHSDLPSSFEPIINYNGIPTLEYLFPSYAIKIFYNYLACLQLNNGYSEGRWCVSVCLLSV